MMSMPTSCGTSPSSSPTSSSTGSDGAEGWNVMVVFSGESVSRTAPHEEQKLESGGFLCPQLLQKTSTTPSAYPSTSPR